MTNVFAWTAAALAVAGGIFVVILALRRLALARDDRLRQAIEERLRPVALALVDGEDTSLGAIGSREARVLADLLARYAQWLTGESRHHAAAFFERRGEVARAVRDLDDRRAWRRAAAAYALGNMGSPTAVPALVATLGDRDAEARAAAARSLGRLAASEAVEPLLYALSSGAVPRPVAGQALLAIGPRSLPALRELEHRADPAVRATAVELVGLPGDASDAPILVQRLRDSSAEVRAKAARALGRLGAAEAARELRAALDERIPFVRASAAFALGAIGDRDALEALLAKAREDQFEPAHAAARAAARIDPHAVRRAADEGGPHLREAADLIALGPT